MKNLGILLLLTCMLSTATAVQAQKTWVKSNKRKTTNSLANPTKDSNYSREKAAEMSRKADEEARQKAIQDSIKKAEYAAMPEGLFWEPSQRNYIGPIEKGSFKLHEFFPSTEYSYGEKNKKWQLSGQLHTDLTSGKVQMVVRFNVFHTNTNLGNVICGSSLSDSQIDECIKALNLMKIVSKQRGNGIESRVEYRNSGSDDSMCLTMKDTGKGWKLTLTTCDDDTFEQANYETTVGGYLRSSRSQTLRLTASIDIPLEQIDEIINKIQEIKDFLTEAKRKKTAK